MGPGFLDGATEAFVGMLVIAAIIIFAAGYGCSRGCDYVKANYTVKIERKP